MKPRTRLALITLSAVLLSACGGGGGGGGTSDANMKVTVATGAPVAGAEVIVVDANGNSKTCGAPTDDSGVVNCALPTNLTAPYFIKAHKGTTALFAVLPEKGGTLNVTPISDVMAKKFAKENSLDPEQLIADPSRMANTVKSKATDAVTLVNAIVQAIANASGITNVSSPLTQAYSATSTDQLDKFIQNIQLNADASHINFSIPTTTGTIAISIAYNVAPTAAATTVASKGITPQTTTLSDGDNIEALLTAVLDKFRTCKAQPSHQTDIINLMSAKDYGNGLKLMNGRTLADWVSRVCDLQFPAFKKTFIRTLGRFGQKQIIQFGAKPADGSSGNMEMTMAFVKDGNAAEYGGWRLLADNSPVNFSVKVRHALEYQIDASANGTSYFQYLRYLDTWAGRGDAHQSGMIPAQVKFYAVPLKTLSENSSTNAAIASYFNGIKNSPTFTIYKSNSGCSTLFSLDSTNLDGSCEFFAHDDRNAAFQSLFTTLQDNEFTMLLIMMVDSSNQCINCAADGVPMTAEILGKAYTVDQIFGSGVKTATELRNGVEMANFTTAMENARTYYAAPTFSELTAMENKIRGNAMGSQFTLTWQRSKDSRQINGSWGGMTVCGLQYAPWNNLPEPVADTSSLAVNYLNYSPISGKTFNNAQYLEFSLANRVNETEFAFYIKGHRNQICQQ